MLTIINSILTVMPQRFVDKMHLDQFTQDRLRMSHLKSPQVLILSQTGVFFHHNFHHNGRLNRKNGDQPWHVLVIFSQSHEKNIHFIRILPWFYHDLFPDPLHGCPLPRSVFQGHRPGRWGCLRDTGEIPWGGLHRWCKHDMLKKKKRWNVEKSWTIICRMDIMWISE